MLWTSDGSESQSATAQIVVASTAGAGARGVDVGKGSELAVLQSGFNVAGTAVVTQVSPNTGQQRQQNPSVCVNGSVHALCAGHNHGFDAGITVASLTVTTPPTP